ncbi:hypothetical protein BSP36_081 [Bacillus phage BSP36]|uniref:Tail assembly chaperone n=1 Tax=Bacillus phage BSP38 TaxID=2283013 RepID=A0A345MJU4_BPBSP|nr:tail assembly chaperone [Bacillus phage BSP38]AXH71126.1 hypothetical protein BSP38_084 [Bacillus phage BSP38]AYJ75168.1 hypothetical protein BSP36_081 [Bacillus phage BSP36]
MSENFEQELGGLMKEKTQEERELEQKVEQKKVIDRIIRGVNDTFEKRYDFPELGESFVIKLRAPNALDTGKIQAKVSAYLQGMNNYASEYIVRVYTALACIRVVGVEVPELLADDEKIYNLDILYKIGVDFQRWLDNFRL